MARKRSCGKVIFSEVSVRYSFFLGGVTSNSLMDRSHGMVTPPPNRTWELDTLPPPDATDMWLSLLETCSNMFTLGRPMVLTSSGSH